MSVIIERGRNPYQDDLQGKANELITVVNLSRRAKMHLRTLDFDCTPEAVYDRLESNAPRVAVIGGSPDHPAHLLDLGIALRAAVRIWNRGGVPFYFGVPVICDAVAQGSVGMKYSLHARNAVAAMIVSQMEAHAYHGAYVIAGCDKTPLAIAAGLAHLDRVRRRRGDAPVFATFNPSHVLRGGTVPADLAADLESVAQRAETQGRRGIACDLREAMRFPLLCTTDLTLHGVLVRAEQARLLSPEQRTLYERRLALQTCDPKGGICAFNGTGNSSRLVLAGLGLAHPGVELLTEPPRQEQVNQVVDDMFSCVNKDKYGVASVLAANFANAVRIYSATGGSTNLMMHLVATMIYAGHDADIWTIDRIRRNPPVPDIFDYRLDEGRSFYELADQSSVGVIRGTETIFYELLNQGIPMDLEAPTVTGTTWEARLADPVNLPASGVTTNPIILSEPGRAFSGVEVLQGNFFQTAVLKASGMTDNQIAQFDDQVGVVLFFETEEDANVRLVDGSALRAMRRSQALSRRLLLAVARFSGRQESGWSSLRTLSRQTLYDRLIGSRVLKMVVVISGQGPEACGMPEMLTPTRYINANRTLRSVTMLVSDGRFSGATYGAAVGHMTPEALRGGLLGLLETGDLLHIQLAAGRIDLLDPQAFVAGRLDPWDIGAFREHRRELGANRRRRILERQRRQAATNRMCDVTDASRGVVPLIAAREATEENGIPTVSV
ncbi:MAG: dihydroxy-acid dehydratase [bacterium]